MTLSPWKRLSAIAWLTTAGAAFAQSGSPASPPASPVAAPATTATHTLTAAAVAATGHGDAASVADSVDGAAARAPRKPNIVFVLTDDQDLPTLAQMPNVQSLLVNQGTNFTRHYVTLSLCCPSRITGLRGQFAHNTTVYQNAPPEGGFEGVFSKGLEQSTVATWLQAGGYRTALFGKYLNGYPNTAPSPKYIPPGWTEWYSPNGGSPYSGFNYKLNENGSTVSYGSAPADYMTDVLSNKAVSFITRTIDANPKQPFFAYIATYAPHGPAVPAPRHENAFPGVTAPRGPAFNEVDVSDKPDWIRTKPPLTSSEIAEIDLLYRHRLQSLLAVDELVANVVKVLEDKGQLNNTYIVFSSDNGFHQGQHRLDSGKITAYEEDLRLPLVIRGPGVKRGGSIDHLTANVDYAPTFAEIARTSAPSFVDGRSLLQLLKGNTPPTWRQALLLEHKLDKAAQALSLALAPANGLLEPADAFEIKGDGANITNFTGLRTLSGYTYVEYETDEFELYDNPVDPAQLNNVYAASSAELRTRLATWLAALKTASGATLRLAEETAP